MISVYGLNSFGRDEVRGNGAIHLPIAPGRWVTVVTEGWSSVRMTLSLVACLC